MIASRFASPALHLFLLITANLLLLTPAGSVWRVVGGLLLIGFLPGLVWIRLLLPQLALGEVVVLGTGLSFSLSILLTLGLHYLPGPISIWLLLATVNVVALTGLAGQLYRPEAARPRTRVLRFDFVDSFLRQHWPLLLILLLALVLRAASLGYSEFQGDEALAMISAAEALTGHEDALFLRGKGPGEVLLPMALWRLSGPVNEGTARLPFALASMLSIITIYFLGQELFNRSTALIVVAIFASSGFMVGFGRIVQYQVIVIWFSSLALLSAWRWYRTGQVTWLGLSGLFLGTGLLAHYDAILVAPALGYVGWLALQNRTTGQAPGIRSFVPAVDWGRTLRASALWLGALLAMALPFYLPYALDPQAARTGDYLEQRFGTGVLKNNFDDFLHYSAFYSSFYYLLVSGALVLGLLAWTWHRWRWGRYWAPTLAVVAVGGIALRPSALQLGGTNWAMLPFGLLFLAAFFSPALRSPQRVAVTWLAVPWLGYNFLVGTPLTHFYTTVPGWALLGGLAAELVHRRLGKPESHRTGLVQPALPALGLLLLAIQSVYLWNAYLRRDLEFWQDFPAASLPFYWTPYRGLPPTGFFGFVHRSGWKAIGQQIAAGDLLGDYGSNEEPEVTTWYTRGAPRACDPTPEFYFLADDVVDPKVVPWREVENTYQEVGLVRLANGKSLSIRQRQPATVGLDHLDEGTLARAFNRSARPEAFARAARGSVEVGANFGGQIRLVGYDLNLERARPGGRLPLTLYWQPLQRIVHSYQVFTHLERERLYAQADGVPVCWTYPTDVWRPGQIIADQHAILLPDDLSPGPYPLTVGLYLAEGNFPRLDILDEAGNPAGTSYLLTTVEIRP